MFTLLTESETQSLIKKTVAIENKAYQVFRENQWLQSHIQAWYKTRGITAGDHKSKKQKLTEILGSPPHIEKKQFEFHNAIWGLQWEDQPFVLYSSERGTSIEVMDRFPESKLLPFLTEIRDTLADMSYRDKLFFQNKYLKVKK
jgi:hypothetical protein